VKVVLLKEKYVWNWRMLRGNEFHILGAETPKETDPHV